MIKKRVTELEKINIQVALTYGVILVAFLLLLIVFKLFVK